jgi:ferredoxin-NADP reductase
LKKIEIEIKAHKLVASDTYEVTFKRPSNFTFLPGQHIQVTIPNLNYTDNRGDSREFSICSPPHNINELSIAFRNTNSGFKRTLLELKKGSSVLAEGPFGHFTLPNGGNHAFVAAGIGITPFLSMIKTAINKELEVNIKLLYANKNIDRAAYMEELNELSLGSKHFQLHSINGPVDAKAINKYVKDVLSFDWWIVGMPKMVAEVKFTLESLGVPSLKIRTEDFIGYY